MTKDELRLLVRQARRVLSPDARTEAGWRIAEAAQQLVTGSNHTITSYLHLPFEPPTDILNRHLLQAGHQVLVPRIVGSDLHWARFTEQIDLGIGPMGIREPRGPAVPLSDVHTMFVPALAVDRRGMRLGQGGGFFDRTLATIARHSDGGPLIVAVTFADEFVEEVPAEWFDHAVDALVTPTGLTRFT